jgi:hypothetical protein
MFTTDRINRLLLLTGGVTIPAGSLFRYGTPAHDALDIIDKKVGIITRNRPRLGRAIYGGGLARVRRLCHELSLFHPSRRQGVSTDLASNSGLGLPNL